MRMTTTLRKVYEYKLLPYIFQQVYESKLFPFFHGKFLENTMLDILKDNPDTQLSTIPDPVLQRKLGVDDSCNGKFPKEIHIVYS